MLHATHPASIPPVSKIRQNYHFITFWGRLTHRTCRDMFYNPQQPRNRLYNTARMMPESYRMVSACVGGDSRSQSRHHAKVRSEFRHISSRNSHIAI